MPRVVSWKEILGAVIENVCVRNEDSSIIQSNIDSLEAYFV